MEWSQIDDRTVGDVTILDLKGRITVDEGNGLLTARVKSLIQQHRARIVLNLRNVRYLDSPGLSEIVRAHIAVTRNGGRLKLVNVGGRLHELLSITRLLTVLDTFESEDEAIRSFGDRAIG